MPCVIDHYTEQMPYFIYF